MDEPRRDPRGRPSHPSRPDPRHRGAAGPAQGWRRPPGPTGVLRVPSAALSWLEMAAGEAGIAAVGYFAQIPHYVSGPYAPASVELLKSVERHLDIELPRRELADEGRALRLRLDAAAAADETTRTYVERLESWSTSRGCPRATVASGATPWPPAGAGAPKEAPSGPSSRHPVRRQRRALPPRARASERIASISPVCTPKWRRDGSRRRVHRRRQYRGGTRNRSRQSNEPHQVAVLLPARGRRREPRAVLSALASANWREAAREPGAPATRVGRASRRAPARLPVRAPGHRNRGDRDQRGGGLRAARAAERQRGHGIRNLARPCRIGSQARQQSDGPRIGVAARAEPEAGQRLDLRLGILDC